MVDQLLETNNPSRSYFFDQEKVEENGEEGEEENQEQEGLEQKGRRQRRLFVLKELFSLFCNRIEFFPKETQLWIEFSTVLETIK